MTKPSDRTTTIIVFLLLAALFASIQFSFPSLAEYDGYYHIKYAYLLRTDGWIREFPWLQFTTWRSHFSDMHLLFHVILIPFTFGNLVIGAKLAVVLFAASAVFLFYRLLGRTGTAHALFWTLFLFSASSSFLYRYGLLRAGPVSLFLLLLGFYWIVREKHVRLLVTSAVYALTYTAFPLVVVLALVFSAVRSIQERAIRFRPVLFSGGGVLLGLLLNPYFPDNLSMYYTQMIRLPLSRGEVPAGTEWYPYDLSFLLSASIVLFVAYLATLLLLCILDARLDGKTITMLVLSVLFLVLTLFSRRHVEYLVPFTVLFCAYACDPLWKSAPRKLRRPVGALLWIVVLSFGGFNIYAVASDLADHSPLHRYEAAAKWLEQNSREGEVVFNADWDDFPGLFFYNSHNYYCTGMDPAFTYLLDRDLWSKYAKITLGMIENPCEIIHTDFRAAYVFTDMAHGPLIAHLNADPRCVKRYGDRFARVYELVPRLTVEEPSSSSP
jgi:hypothetical protein